MEQNMDFGASDLLCAENTSCLDDFDCNATVGCGISPSWHRQGNGDQSQETSFNNNRPKSLMGSIIQSDEIITEMIEREREHLPRNDYLSRLRSGHLDMSVRREALDWILKAQIHHGFGPLSVCLAMNYLDRFLSVSELPKGKAWTSKLLGVACLSLAAKMEETKVPLSVDLQVGEPNFVFEAKTIQRMELLVLSTLNWRMLAFTPCSFIDYFLRKVHDDQHFSTSSITNSVKLILGTIKGIHFLEFRPSEIAAAVAISVSGEVQTVDMDKAMSGLIHVEKGRVLKCMEIIKDLSLISGCTAVNVASASGSSVPQSPYGVLDAACLSYKTDDSTVGSCANSPHNSTEIKRRVQDSRPFQVEQE